MLSTLHLKWTTFGFARLSSPQLGLARVGFAQPRSAGVGLAWLSVALRGTTWLGKAMVCPTWPALARQGCGSSNVVRLGRAWLSSTLLPRLG